MKLNSESTYAETNIKKEQLPENPRKAATRFKEMNNHIEMMKRRFKVLQGQQQYNRYRTIDHQRRINHHQNLHAKLLKDRQELRKSLEKMHDISEVKERTVQIRQQLRDRLRSARQSVLQQRTDRYHSIIQDEATHEEKIKINKEKEERENRDKKLMVRHQEEVKRESLSRHQEERVRNIKMNKSIDAERMIKKTERKEQELQKLMAYEQELLKKSCQSLQASQVMRNKFNSVFPAPSSRLPEIRARTNNSQHSKHTLTMSSEGMLLL